MVYRLGEPLMMKAECLIRNGDAEGAVKIVNDVRKRSFDQSLPESKRCLTAEQLAATVTVNGVQVQYGEFLNELGREFTGEGMRREHLIRFGVYTTGTWWGHAPKNEKYLELYPIPEVERLSNPKLGQNDGYPQ